MVEDSPSRKFASPSQQKKIQVKWHIPVILATVGNINKRPIFKITIAKRAGGIASECLPSQVQTLVLCHPPKILSYYESIKQKYHILLSFISILKPIGQIWITTNFSNILLEQSYAHLCNHCSE
jgi:hypothetical protein